LPTRNALDVHMLRLRRRLEPLGLEVRTVRSRGYVLQPATNGNANGNGTY
jgi:DNA-binding response OmpR family regulator